jgi:hypothetical protein
MTARSLTWATAAVVATVALAGCASPDGGDGPGAVEQAFLDALSSGDGTAALALTTAGADRACTDVIDDYDDLGSGVAAGEVGETAVNGDTATPGACAARPTDGTFDVVALPGAYQIGVRDPSGVFGSRVFAAVGVLVSDSTDAGSTQKVPFIDDAVRAQVAIDIQNALLPRVEECAESAFASSCPPGLPAGGSSVTVAERPSERFTGLPTVSRLYSDDGQTWRFEAGGQEFLFQRDGVAARAPMEFTGALTATPAGVVEVVLD